MNKRSEAESRLSYGSGRVVEGVCNSGTRILHWIIYPFGQKEAQLRDLLKNAREAMNDTIVIPFSLVPHLGDLSSPPVCPPRLTE